MKFFNINVKLVDSNEEYTAINGFVVPRVGDSISWPSTVGDGYSFLSRKSEVKVVSVMWNKYFNSALILCEADKK